MAEWLGKPKRSIKDMSPYWQKRAFLAKCFEELPMARITVVLSHNDLDKFVKTVNKRYGKFTATTVNSAAAEAINKWMQEIEKSG